LETIYRKLRFLAIATGVAIALVVILPLYFLYSPAESGDNEPVEVKIKDGSSLSIVAGQLDNAGLIKSGLLFIAYIKVRGQENDLKSGRYIFSRSMNIPVIASMIIGGRSESDDVVVTIPEGFNIWEVDKRVASSGLIAPGQLAGYYLHKEGYLFPDTYHFDREVSAEGIANKMEENYFAKNGTNNNETLIIASLLEKEVKTKEDMALVAGIIKKRLELGMLLQIDASVAYGWCLKEVIKTEFKNFCDVTQAPIALEIRIDGPYNTYIRKGLPSGPISNPGLQAVEATLNFKESDYLYYLSTRDGSQMIYSKTSAEHAGNRRKYLGI